MQKFLQNCKRTLQVAKKPDKDEYKHVAKITGIGILLVGFIGFIIMFLASLLTGITRI